MDGRLVESRDECRRIARRAGSNFVRCFRFLPPEKRSAMEILYAFMRVTDDLADDLAGEAPDRKKSLVDWRKGVETALSTWEVEVVHPRERILPALVETVRQYEIDTADLLAVVDGCLGDATGPVRFESEADAFRYCDQVATAVGRATLAVLGTTRPRSDSEVRTATVACGRAFQWTNFLRDIREDFDRERLYFPMSDFAESRLAPEDLFRLLVASKRGGGKTISLVDYRLADSHDPLAVFFLIQRTRTESLYNTARPLAGWVANDSRLFFDLMFTVYETIFQKINYQPSAIFRKRVRLSLWEKWSIFWRKKSTYATEIDRRRRKG